MSSTDVKAAERRDAGPAVVPGLPTRQPLDELLQSFVLFAVDVLPEVSGASLALLKGRSDELESVQGGPAEIVKLDRLQHDTGCGPSVLAVRTGQEVKTSIPALQWPDFSEAAESAQVRAAWSLPLHVGERVAGSFNLYSVVPSPWLGPWADAVRILAGQATALLTATVTLAESQHTNATLLQALETRTVIGQAQGVLMARQGVTPDEAFDILRRASQRTNRKLREVAAEIVEGVIDHGAGHAHRTRP